MMIIILDIYVGGTERGRRVNIIWSLRRILQIDIHYIIIYNNRPTVPLNSEREKRGQNDIVYECTGYTAIGWSDRHFIGRFQISLPIVHIIFIHIFFVIVCTFQKTKSFCHIYFIIVIFSLKLHGMLKA